MIKPMRKDWVPGHIREIKSNEITRGKNVKPVQTLQNVKIRIDNNKVIKKVNCNTLWNPKVFSYILHMTS